jgi:hypothetical protein
VLVQVTSPYADTSVKTPSHHELPGVKSLHPSKLITLILVQLLKAPIPTVVTVFLILMLDKPIQL